MARVQLREVSKVYPGGVAAVRGVSLDIAPEEFVVLVGPSGCGKSTTLRMVAGLETPESGTILIGGRVVNDVPPRDRDIAMVFQSYALYPHLSVRDNLAFALQVRGAPRRQIDQRVGEVARLLGIEALLGRRPAALSGGQRQRVAVGRALVRAPACFLFDEPLSNLDALLRAELRVELKRLQQALRATTLYVTHDQEEAMTLGDRVVVLRDGVIQQCGAPLALYGHPANRFVATFVGAMNLWPGHLRAEGGALVFCASASEGAAPQTLPVPPWAQAVLARRAPPGAPLLLGLRPEALQPAPAGTAGLRGVVTLIEALGDRMNVHLEVAGRALLARFPADAALRVGAALTLTIDPERLRFFAADDDGASLTTAEAP